MTTWLTVGLLVALTGPGIIADSVDVDFPENVNSRFGGSRIVSGWEAEEGQLPWQVSLRMANLVGQVSACGGSVIHKWWILTAAHCTAGRINFVYRATTNLTRPAHIGEADEFYNHPLYNNALPGVVQPHDIGVLKIKDPFTFSKILQPIRMQRSADMNYNYDGVRLVASGFGLTWTQGTSPENLNWVYLLGDSNQRCRAAYGGSSIIVDSTICASHYNVTSQSTCQGDSGGPLTVWEKDGKPTVIGVASFVSGTGCHTDFPAGFIQPGHYHDWFYQVTGINFDWDWEPETEESEESSPKSEESDESAPSSPKPEESEESSPKSEESDESAPSSPKPEESEESAPTSTPKPEASEESASEPSSEESTSKPSSDESASQPSSEELPPKPSEESVQESISDEPSEEDSNGDSSDTRSDSSDSRPKAISFGRM